jgi:hypothetical protein
MAGEGLKTPALDDIYRAYDESLLPPERSGSRWANYSTLGDFTEALIANGFDPRGVEFTVYEDDVVYIRDRVLEGELTSGDYVIAGPMQQAEGDVFAVVPITSPTGKTINVNADAFVVSFHEHLPKFFRE